MLIAFRLKLLLACAAGFAGPLAVAPLVSEMSTRDAQVEPVIIEIARGSFAYREAGDFTRAGRPAEAPLRTLQFAKSLHIMRDQVSSADYQLCVRDRECHALDRGVAVASDRPAVQVSWHDAQAYADGGSRQTGHRFRLRNGPLPQAPDSGMTARRSTRTIPQSAGSAATSASPNAISPTPRPIRSASSA